MENSNNYVLHTENNHICNKKCGNLCIKTFHSKKNIDQISSKITELLKGFDKKNRSIIVPNSTIYNVMLSVYTSFIPKTGDIFSRYNILKDNKENYIQTMIDDVINIIVTDIKNNIEIDECNKKLNIWTTVLGDFNEHGLRSHNKIKLREKRPMPMAFNMNY